MVEITGTPMMTVTLSSGITRVKYETAVSVDIYNAAENDIYISNADNFDNGAYFIIPGGGSYNNLHIGTAAGTDLYIKSESASSVSIVCGRY